MPIFTTDLYTRALSTTVHKNLYEASFYTNELMWDWKRWVVLYQYTRKKIAKIPKIHPNVRNQN